MDMGHRCPGFIGPVDRLRDLLCSLRNDLIRLLALDTSVASHANDERRHPRANSFHELFAIGVVKPSRLLRRFCVFLYRHRTPSSIRDIRYLELLRGNAESVSTWTIKTRPEASRIRPGIYRAEPHIGKRFISMLTSEIVRNAPQPGTRQPARKPRRRSPRIATVGRRIGLIVVGGAV